ncbi:GNAT family N-acetyltransferase [Christiangramia aquimixticola]|uniref:GNAT family N-acetyltransferase n=1 Tax=Christiangramia aquimixticola TaxID=1697558 RepID=UPI003AA9DDF9
MEIRKAQEKDLPEILEVLKSSLGETSSQKTETVWNYKHVENPFGKSLVLVACLYDKIVGVRAFMCWQWNYKGRKLSAFRAVDTATDPAHRGKGIFKKLTLKALEIGEKENISFVFNTPNSLSKPGYLKMGWKEVNKIGLSISPANPLNFLKKGQFDPIIKQECSKSEFVELLEKYNESLRKNNKLFTIKNENFLDWRYQANALQKYHVVKNKDFYLAAYLKDRGKYKELRISELIFISSDGKKKAKKEILELSSNCSANFVSYSHANFKLGLLSYTGNIGPVLTLKGLNIDKSDALSFYNLKNWDYSLGDLELF